MKIKKDILFLCQYFYPEYISSATLPYDTAFALQQSGFKVGVICGYPKEYYAKNLVATNEVYNGIEIRRLKYLQTNRHSFIGRLINYFSFTLAVLTKFCLFRMYKSVIVYSNPPILPIIAYLASRVFGTKIIFVSYDVYPEIAIRTKTVSENGILSKTMSLINSFLFKRVTKVVALSDDMKDFILSHRKQLVSNQIVVIPNWCNDSSLKNREESYSNDLYSKINLKEKFVVSYFGNMGTAQDLDTLIEAMKILKSEEDIVFVFAGHGNKVAYLKEIVHGDDLRNVYIYDYLICEDFEDALNISDIFIVSLSEGLTGLAVPSKTYNYMRAGKPIISIMSKSASLSQELVEKEAGYSIEVGDVSSLISIIQLAKSDEIKNEIMGSNARKVFLDKYVTSKSTSKYVMMMEEILEDN